MSNKEKFELIEKTIKEVQGNFTIERLIQDCSDKLSLPVNEVKNILIEFDSNLLIKFNCND
jgi:hypothetical protein